MPSFKSIFLVDFRVNHQILILKHCDYNKQHGFYDNESVL